MRCRQKSAESVSGEFLSKLHVFLQKNFCFLVGWLVVYVALYVSLLIMLLIASASALIFSML